MVVCFNVEIGLVVYCMYPYICKCSKLCVCGKLIEKVLFRVFGYFI